MLDCWILTEVEWDNYNVRAGGIGSFLKEGWVVLTEGDRIWKGSKCFLYWTGKRTKYERTILSFTDNITEPKQRHDLNLSKSPPIGIPFHVREGPLISLHHVPLSCPPSLTPFFSIFVELLDNTHLYFGSSSLSNQANQQCYFYRNIF